MWCLTSSALASLPPFAGAKKEGLWGLVKGTGKGFVGLVLRPTGGLIDLTSATLTAVQK